MPALAMGLGFLGYTTGLWGYCLLRGYNVTIGSLLSPLHPPTWASIRGSQIPPGQVFPSGAPPAASEGGGAPVTIRKPPAAGEGGGRPVVPPAMGKLL